MTRAGATGHRPYPRVVAHRGGGALAPENTLGAIRHGASLGFKGVELDVRIAGDGTPVVIHDPTLERTTDGRGEVARLAYAEIARFDAGVRAGDAWRGERVPRFDEAARLCRELQLWANVEIKAPTGMERAVGEAVARAAAELWRGAEPQPVLSSFSAEALEGARSASPELPRALLVSRRALPGWAERLAALECVALHADFALVTEALVREQHAAGRAVLAWTVNDPADARRLLGLGADSLVTDALERIGPEFR
ncbi:MAG: glycerophosphodiester phosphodiesterase [Betaproteobacteria bacterium]|nr:glycerophosphodiester phosphodiesterase [Betaproteobacteria bacterium]